MLQKQTRKLKRSIQIVKILAKYGFEDLAIRSGLAKPKPFQQSLEDPTQTEDLFVRIRQVLEELGGTFVKFGQALSVREDLLPAGLIVELKKLQDQVSADEVNIRLLFEDQFGQPIEDVFEVFEEQPMASASLSQVYKAILKSGQKVVLKVIRPGIRKTVATDLLILKDLVKVLNHYSENLRKVHLEHVASAFTNSITEELSLLQEQKNIIRFNHNFRGHPDVHQVQVHTDYSNNDILCMDLVEGVKITDLEMLQAWRLQPEAIVKKGFNLYMTQILEHGFFHADPHPGNILVLPSGQLSFIDMGSMGSLIPPDKDLLEDFVVQFMKKDARRLRLVIQKMSIQSTIEDTVKFERDLLDVFYMLEGNSLGNIDVKAFFTKFSSILNNNDIQMQEHLYILVRGIVLIEGVGRALWPEFDVIKEIQPFVQKAISKKLDPKEIIKRTWNDAYDLQEILRSLPMEMSTALHQLNKGDYKIKVEMTENAPANSLKVVQLKIFGLGLILLSSAITGSVLSINSHSPWQIYFSVFCFVIGFFCALGILYNVFFPNRRA